MTIPVTGYGLFYPPLSGPITQIQPFTYSDSLTFVDILSDLKKHVEKLREFFNNLGIEVDDKIVELIAAVDTALAAQNVDVDSKLDAQNSANAIAIQALTDYVNTQVQSIIDSSIEVSTPIVLDVAASRDKFAALNVWEEFRVDGSGGHSWDATTYDNWITGIDNLLNGAAVKTAIGVDDANNTIYAYTAGNPLAPHALVVGGTHPIESLSMHAAMRYFTDFVKSNHPEIKGMRNHIRLSWIPTLTPSGYLSNRHNSSGVDVNRNFDFFWKYFEVAPPTESKGVSAGIAAEVKAVKAFIDANPITLVIDCHVDSTIANLSWAGGSAFSGANQSLGWAAKTRYERAYGLSAVRYGGDAWIKTGAPSLSNRADHYMRNNLSRPNAVGVIFESNHQLSGSISLTYSSKAGMKAYCGLIHSFILEWLSTGQAATQVREQSWLVGRGARNPGETISTGGSKIDTQVYAPVWFDSMPGAAGLRPFLDAPIPAPGNVMVDGVVVIENPHTAAITIQARLTSVETPEAGNVAGNPIPAASAIATIQPGSHGVISLGGRLNLPSVDKGRMQRFMLEVRQYLPGAVPATPAVLYDVKMEARFYPDTYASPWPTVKRPL